MRVRRGKCGGAQLLRTGPGGRRDAAPLRRKKGESLDCPRSSAARALRDGQYAGSRRSLRGAANAKRPDRAQPLIGIAQGPGKTQLDAVAAKPNHTSVRANVIRGRLRQGSPELLPEISSPRAPALHIGRSSWFWKSHRNRELID